ncbi:MAG TPA: DnaA/Hda family protein, partial [Longimicrobiales bacterium]|nr:DnaA/Hda family protein [Longimicrobiales bacterium]
MELTAAELWSRIQESVRGSVPEHGYRTWVAGAEAIGLSADELIVEAPSRFHVEWLEDKYGPLIAAAAQRALGRPINVTVTCSDEPRPIPMPPLELTERAPAGPDSPAPTGQAGPAVRPQLNERYTFERFVVGTNNQLAVAASRAVAERPARMYNPLFLYGGVGLGKTHLMHAVGHRLLVDDSRRHVAYVSSEQFTNELVGSIQEGTMAAFRRRYRQMDLLLV